MPDELVIASGDTTRLMVKEYATAGHVARELGPALATVAATIDASPVDPMPTDADRESSRMPGCE